MKVLYWPLWAAIALTGCGGSTQPEPDTKSAAASRRLPDLAAVPTVEICREHVADSGADVAVDAQAPGCTGCFVEDGGAAVDRDYDTTATFGAGPDANGMPFSLRVGMPAGLTYGAPRVVAAIVTEPARSSQGASVFSARFRTYLGGVLQEDLNSIGYGIRVGGTGGSFAVHGAQTQLPFDALEYVYTPSFIAQPEIMRIHELCVALQEWQ